MHSKTVEIGNISVGAAWPEKGETVLWSKETEDFHYSDLFVIGYRKPKKYGCRGYYLCIGPLMLLLELLEEANKEANDEETENAWMCVCGNYQEDGCHCSSCGAEPPWGCPCSQCQNPDDDAVEDFGLEFKP